MKWLSAGTRQDLRSRLSRADILGRQTSPWLPAEPTRAQLPTTYCLLPWALELRSRFASYWLNLGSAPVNEQFDTSNETRVIRRQKQRHLGNFLGLPHAPHQDGGHNPRNHVGRLPTHQRRIDRARTNNV